MVAHTTIGNGPFRDGHPDHAIAVSGIATWVLHVRYQISGAGFWVLGGGYWLWATGVGSEGLTYHVSTIGYWMLVS